MVRARGGHSCHDTMARCMAGEYPGWTKGSYYDGGGARRGRRTKPARPQVSRGRSLAYDRQRDLTAQAGLYARFSTGSGEHKALVGVEYGFDRWRFDVRNPPVGVNIPIDLNSPVYGQRAAPNLLVSDGTLDSDAAAAQSPDES